LKCDVCESRQIDVINDGEREIYICRNCGYRKIKVKHVDIELP